MRTSYSACAVLALVLSDPASAEAFNPLAEVLDKMAEEMQNGDEGTYFCPPLWTEPPLPPHERRDVAGSYAVPVSAGNMFQDQEADLRLLRYGCVQLSLQSAIALHQKNTVGTVQGVHVVNISDAADSPAASPAVVAVPPVLYDAVDWGVGTYAFHEPFQWRRGIPLPYTLAQSAEPHLIETYSSSGGTGSVQGVNIVNISDAAAEQPFDPFQGIAEGASQCMEVYLPEPGVVQRGNVIIDTDSIELDQARDTENGLNIIHAVDVLTLPGGSATSSDNVIDSSRSSYRERVYPPEPPYAPPVPTSVKWCTVQVEGAIAMDSISVPCGSGL
jgi:hypothetical protein